LKFTGHLILALAWWLLISAVCRAGVAARVVRSFDSYLVWMYGAMLIFATSLGRVNDAPLAKVALILDGTKTLALPLTDAMRPTTRATVSKLAAPLCCLYWLWLLMSCMVDEAFMQHYVDKDTGDLTAMAIDAVPGKPRQIVFLDLYASSLFQLIILITRVGVVMWRNPRGLTFARTRLAEEEVDRQHGENILLAEWILYERSGKKCCAGAGGPLPPIGQIVPAPA